MIPDRAGIFGHSMGGHGAISIYLKNPDKYVVPNSYYLLCFGKQYNLYETVSAFQEQLECDVVVECATQVSND